MTVTPQSPFGDDIRINTLTSSGGDASTSADRVAFGIYRPSAGGQIRQGEILSNVIQIKIDVSALKGGGARAIPVVHPFAIVLTQDCDCEQDFRSRSSEGMRAKLIPNVLFCEVASAEELRGSNEINSTIWNQVKINKNERYHFLQKVPKELDALGEGLPELGIDFKRVFSIPTDEIYYRIECGDTQRRCGLLSPYLEHLSSRFSYFLQRVALPHDHASEPLKG